LGSDIITEIEVEDTGHSVGPEDITDMDLKYEPRSSHYNLDCISHVIIRVYMQLWNTQPLLSIT
jgi:hypothetical protein